MSILLFNEDNVHNSEISYEDALYHFCSRCGITNIISIDDKHRIAKNALWEVFTNEKTGKSIELCGHCYETLFCQEEKYW
jgi:hypothetical protein